MSVFKCSFFSSVPVRPPLVETLPVNQYSCLNRLRNDSPHDVTQSIFSARLCFVFWTCTDSDCVCSGMPKQRWPTLSTGPEGILWWHWHRSSDPSRRKRLNQSSEVALNYLKCLRVKKNASRMRNIEIFKSICVWCDIYSSSGIDSGVFPHRSLALSAAWGIWRRNSHKCSVKSKSYQSRRARYFPALSCSQDPTVSQTEMLTKQVLPPLPPPRWLAPKGAEGRSHIIWQAKRDIFIRSSTPSWVAADVSLGNPLPLQTSTAEMRPDVPTGSRSASLSCAEHCSSGTLCASLHHFTL